MFLHVVNNLEIHTSCRIVFERISGLKNLKKNLGKCVLFYLLYKCDIRQCLFKENILQRNPQINYSRLDSR